MKRRGCRSAFRNARVKIWARSREPTEEMKKAGHGGRKKTRRRGGRERRKQGNGALRASGRAECSLDLAAAVGGLLEAPAGVLVCTEWEVSLCRYLVQTTR